jgi:hypothetical protein
MEKQNIVVSYLGGEYLLVYQYSTGGGLNLTFQEARELIKMLTARLPIEGGE